jgi:type I restriction enzyme S subunit
MASALSPGTIPARGFDWDRVVFPPRRAGEFADLLYGKSLVESKRTAGSVPVYGTNGRCGWHNKGLQLGPGVILGRKGQGPLGVEWCDGPFWVIDTAYFATVNNEVDLKWFYYIVKYVGLNHLKSGEKPGLQRDTFRAQLFPFPPRDVQTEIAHLLSALDAKIASNREVNTRLEALSTELFRSWFVDFDSVTARRDGRMPLGVPAEAVDLFPRHFEESELGPIPQGWRVQRLATLTTTQYGFTASASSRPVGPHLLRITDMNKEPWIDWSTVPYCEMDDALKERYSLRVGDILVSRMADPGKAGIVEESVNAVFASYLVRLETAPSRRYWLYYFLRSDDYRDYADGAQAGTVQANMNAQVIVDARAVIPPEELSLVFNSVVRPLRTQIVANLGESRKIAELRDTLLGPLLSGELKIKAVETVVGSAI